MGIKQYEAVCILVSPVRNILELPNGKYTMNEDRKLVVQSQQCWNCQYGGTITLIYMCQFVLLHLKCIHF